MPTFRFSWAGTKKEGVVFFSAEAAFSGAFCAGGLLREHERKGSEKGETKAIIYNRRKKKMKNKKRDENEKKGKMNRKINKKNK